MRNHQLACDLHHSSLNSSFKNEMYVSPYKLIVICVLAKFREKLSPIKL